VIPLCTRVETQTYPCKNLSPLEAIKGEAGHRLRTRSTLQTTLNPSHSRELTRALCHLQSQDLGLPPSLATSLYPLLQALQVQDNTQFDPLNGRRESLPELV
jgi:hypothetical protein